jgi:hypothetical protein
VLGDWMNRKHEEYGQSVHRQGRLRAFMKDPLVAELKNYSTLAETGYPE